MPHYDYFCADCQKRVTVFQSYRDYGVQPVHCPDCGGARLKRLLNRVRVLRNDDQRLDQAADPAFLDGVDESDPRSLGRAMRRMGQELGEEMPAEFDEVTRRLESGEAPESIEKDMPDLAGGGPADGGLGDED